MERINEQKHPSFGLVQISRVNTNPARTFFGSNIKSSSSFELKISQASTYMDEFGHRHFWDESTPFVKIVLSQNQLSELITTFNVGKGVPCTIQYLNGKKVDDCPNLMDDIGECRKIVKQQMIDQINSATDSIKRLKSILMEKGSLKKSEKEEVLDLINIIMQRIPKNTQFYMDQIAEVGSKVVTQVKADIDAMMTHAIHFAGIEAIKKDPSMLQSQIHKSQHIEYIEEEK